jgi:hypothetical protein
MRNLLALGALLILVFVGLGWYLGWYKIVGAPTGDGHTKIQIDLNTNKIKTDVGKGEAKVHDWLTEQNGTVPQPTNVTTTGTTTSFLPSQDGTSVFPAPSPPPGGGTTLPPPR